jgi:hypothetical protein
VPGPKQPDGALGDDEGRDGGQPHPLPAGPCPA